MKISVRGALVGAAVGAVARSAVVLLNLGHDVSPLFVFPSAAIGLLVGLIAGATARPLVGAVVGALLSAIVFELFMLPCASLIGTFGDLTGNDGAQGEFLRKTAVYALEMGVAGFLAGGMGGWVGSRALAAQSIASEAKTVPEKGA
jgi:hypothetical protein